MIILKLLFHYFASQLILFLCMGLGTKSDSKFYRDDKGCSTCYLKDPTLPHIYQIKYSTLSVKCNEMSSQKEPMVFPTDGKLGKCGTKSESCSLPGKSCKETKDCCGPMDITKIYRVGSDGKAAVLKSAKTVKSSTCYKNKCHVSPCMPGKKCKGQTCYVQSPTAQHYKSFKIFTCNACYQENKGDQPNPNVYTGTGLKFPDGVVQIKLGKKDNFACKYCAILDGKCESDNDCCPAPYLEFVYNTFSQQYKQNEHKVTEVKCAKNKCIAANCLINEDTLKDFCSADSSVKCCPLKDEYTCKNALALQGQKCLPKQYTYEPKCLKNGKTINRVRCPNFVTGAYCNCYPPKHCRRGECKSCAGIGEECKSVFDCCGVAKYPLEAKTNVVECKAGKCNYCVPVTHDEESTLSYNKHHVGCNFYPCCGNYVCEESTIDNTLYHVCFVD